jgi:hypothetical protein
MMLLQANAQRTGIDNNGALVLMSDSWMVHNLNAKFAMQVEDSVHGVHQVCMSIIIQYSTPMDISRLTPTTSIP